MFRITVSAGIKSPASCLLVLSAFWPGASYMHVNCTQLKIIIRENPGGFCTELNSFLVMNSNSHQMYSTRFWKKSWSIAQMQQHQLNCLQGADRSFSISQGLRCRNTVKTTFSHFVDGNTGESGGTDCFRSWGWGAASSTMMNDTSVCVQLLSS